MLRLVLPIAILLALFTSLSAQPGAKAQDVVIFADGTSSRGTIIRASKADYSKQVALRSPDGSVEVYGPNSLQGYSFGKQGRTFRAVTADIPDPQLGGVEVSQRRFAEVLIDGDLELLRVNLSGNEYNAKAIGTQDYFYLLRQGEIELTLELTTILVYEILHANPSRFRNKLKFFVRDCPAALEMARRADFTDASIMRILGSYATCKKNLNLVMDAGRVPSGVDFKHFTRLAHLSLRDKNYSEQQFSFQLGYQLEASFTNRMKWLGVLVSADYVYHTFRWQEQTNVAQSMIKGNLSLGVYPVKRPDFSVQLTAGLSNYNAFESSFNSFFSNNYFLLSGGVRVQRNNFLLDLSYEHMPDQITRQPGNILLLGAGYRVRF